MHQVVVTHETAFSWVESTEGGVAEVPSDHTEPFHCSTNGST